MSNKDSFNYTYSAKEQEEIKNIRMKYTAPVEENKMEQLRRLDKRVSSKAAIIALTVGIIGTLVMGTGMSLVMTDIGSFFDPMARAVIGVGAGVVGIVLAAVAYPIYNRSLKRGREKAAPEILRLADELTK